MDQNERDEYQRRIAEFDDAKNRKSKYEKLLTTIQAIAANERHEIGEIVFDCVDGEIWYRDQNHDAKRRSRICSLSETDHGEFFGGFLDWAEKTLVDKICEMEAKQAGA